AFISLSDGTTLLGSGSIRLEGSAAVDEARLKVLGTTIVESGLTIATDGNGSISGGGTIDLRGTMRVEAASTMLLESCTVEMTPTGVMCAVGGTFGLGASTTIRNGRLQTSAGGAFRVLDSAIVSFENVQNQGTLGIDDGGALHVDGLLNDGTVVVNTSGGTLGSSIEPGDGTSISGTGSIVLNGASDASDALVLVNGSSFLGANQTIDATGLGLLAGQGTLSNGGTLQATGGGTLVIGDFVFGGIVIDQTSGGLLRAADASIVRILNADLQGGTLETGGTGLILTEFGGTSNIDDVHLTGVLGLVGRSTVIADSFVNDGTIIVNQDATTLVTTLRLEDGMTIGGTGTIDLRAPASDDGATISIDDGQTATLGAGQHVRGRLGRLFGGGTLFNEGTIGADAGGEVRLDGVTIDQSGGGRLSPTDDGVVRIEGDSVVIGRTFESSNGGAVVASGLDILVDGDVHVTGTFGLETVSVGAIVTMGSMRLDGEMILNLQSSNSTSIATLIDGAVMSGDGTIVFNGFTQPSNALLDLPASQTATLQSGLTLTGRLGGFGGDGTFQVHSRLDPGTESEYGSFAIDATVLLGPDAMTRLDLGGTDVATHDTLVGSGTLELGGDLFLRHAPAYEPSFGDRYTIISGPTVIGEFASVTGDPLTGVLVRRTFYGPTAVQVRITCPEDLDGSFALDIFDVIAFLGEFDAQTELGDWNGDTVYDIFDVLAYLGDFDAACE
ncbi:MAG: hypothetical protein KDA28_16900, partial [Phycisphaerales bacterium]|nr:hypothetical protein [Phycisphaerales bacterium]